MHPDCSSLRTMIAYEYDLFLLIFNVTTRSMFILKMTFITWTNLSYQPENLILQPLGPFQMTHVSKGLIISVETRTHLSYSCLQHLAITSMTFFSDGGTTVSVTHLQGKMENRFTRCNNFLISECIAVNIQSYMLKVVNMKQDISFYILSYMVSTKVINWALFIDMILHHPIISCIPGMWLTQDASTHHQDVY